MEHYTKFPFASQAWCKLERNFLADVARQEIDLVEEAASWRL